MKLTRRSATELAQRSQRISDRVLQQVTEIIDGVKERGEEALLDYSRSLDGRTPDEPLYLTQKEMQRFADQMKPGDRERLERIAGRIESFAVAQRDALANISVPVPGGTAGHSIEPLERAGCYAPGGRYPLPSSALMTVVPARVAGVESIWVASPRPAAITIAAARIAGAHGFLAAGGAHAIAALAYGVGPIPPSDIVVGPGNAYVTAAKLAIARDVAVDMPAGPSELVVVADRSSDLAVVAADLLAQAEHDPRALPVLIATSEAVVDGVEAELAVQLRDLPTGDIARAALKRGGVVLCEDRQAIADACNAIAPEHVQLSIEDPNRLLPLLRHYGAAFIGELTGEVFGDYGAGPNHVLPTGQTSRQKAGLSVFNFLRIRTWMRGADARPDDEFIQDVVWLARQEGLEAHARAAEMRSGRTTAPAFPQARGR